MKKSVSLEWLEKYEKKYRNKLNKATNSIWYTKSIGDLLSAAKKQASEKKE